MPRAIEPLSLREEMEVYRHRRNATEAIFQVTAMCTPRSKVMWLYVEGSKRKPLDLVAVATTGLRKSLQESTDSYVHVRNLRPSGLEKWQTVFDNWVKVPPQHAANPCCEDKPYTTVPSEGDSSCYLLNKWLLKNACACNRLGVFRCVKCGVTFCNAAGCSERDAHNDHLKILNRSPCPQVLITEGGGLTFRPSPLVQCECGKNVCASCTQKYTHAAVIENVPNEWRDGDIIEGLEATLGAQVVEYERQCRDRHFYVQFDRQVMTLGTQCVKLRDVTSKQEMWIRPPHAPRKVRRSAGLFTVLVDFRKSMQFFPFMEQLVAVIKGAGLKPLDVRYATAKSDSLLIEVVDTRAKEVLLALLSVTIRGTSHFISTKKHSTEPLHRTSTTAPPAREELTFYMELCTWFDTIQ